MNFVNYKLKTFISVLFSYSVVLFDWKIVDEKGKGTLALLIIFAVNKTRIRASKV